MQNNLTILTGQPDNRCNGTATALAGSSWLWIAMLAVLAFIMFGYPLFLDIPFLDPDEGLHAAIAQEMVESGDYVQPHLLGVSFSDKPILFFWAQAISLRIFGMNEAAVRLPGLLFALFGSLTTMLLGWRWFGRNAGLLAGMFHMTLLMPLALAQAPVHDVALVGWTNLVLLAFWNAGHATNQGGAVRQYLLAGVWIGLAILAKGLIGPAIVFVGVGLFLVATRTLRFRLCLGMAMSLLMGAAVAAPWYVMMEIQNPGYCYYYFIERHVLGYVTATQQHGNAPWWYYLPLLLAGGLPWIGFLPTAVRDLWQRRRDAGVTLDSPRTMCWTYLLGGLLFLSTARSKLLTYLLPVFPVVALLAADLWDRYRRGMLSEGCQWMLTRALAMSCAGLAAAMPVAVFVLQRRFDFHFRGVWIGCAAVVLVMLLPLLWLWRGQATRALATATFAVAAIFLFIMTALMPDVAAEMSGRELARHINRQGHLPSRLLVLEERIGSVIFYLDPELRAQLKPDQFVNIQVDGFCELPKLQVGEVAVLPRARESRAREFLDVSAVPCQFVGHYRVYPANELLSKRRS
ncbi:MAG TPA: glycosyltransferase family 39 protein [Gemmataceae bacterium]|nr:glycosyltransferase family 39 protein [Gemmataceae bacterium]